MIYKYHPSAHTGIRQLQNNLAKSIDQQSASLADIIKQFITKKEIGHACKENIKNSFVKQKTEFI